MAHYKYDKTVKVYVPTSELGFSYRPCTWSPYNIGNFLHDPRAKNYKRPSKERCVQHGVSFVYTWFILYRNEFAYFS